jgi:hypothetical protein
MEAQSGAPGWHGMRASRSRTSREEKVALPADQGCLCVIWADGECLARLRDKRGARLLHHVSLQHLPIAYPLAQ